MALRGVYDHSERLHRVEAIEPARIRTSFGRSASNTSQIVCSVSSGW